MLTVSFVFLCYASSAIGQQKSTTQSNLNNSPFPDNPLQPDANGLVQPNSPAQPRGPAESSESKPSGASAPSIDPFQRFDAAPAPPMPRSFPMGRDPFDPILNAVGKTLNEPILYASLPTGELAKAEEKIREMRIACLTNLIEIAKARFYMGGDGGSGGDGLMREYAELIEDLTTLEFQKAKSSDERLAAIQKSIDAWRFNEKIAFEMFQVGSSSRTYFFATQKRLRWEQALVKELRAAAQAKSALQPVVQSSVVQYPTVQQQTVFYPNAQRETTVGQPPPTYYYPSQPTYKYSRSYRSR